MYSLELPNLSALGSGLYTTRELCCINWQASSMSHVRTYPNRAPGTFLYSVEAFTKCQSTAGSRSRFVEVTGCPTKLLRLSCFLLRHQVWSCSNEIPGTFSEPFRLIVGCFYYFHGPVRHKAAFLKTKCEGLRFYTFSTVCDHLLRPFRRLFFDYEWWPKDILKSVEFETSHDQLGSLPQSKKGFWKRDDFHSNLTQLSLV